MVAYDIVSSPLCGVEEPFIVHNHLLPIYIFFLPNQFPFTSYYLDSICNILTIVNFVASICISCFIFLYNIGYL